MNTTIQHLTVRPTSRGIRVWLEGKRLTGAGFHRGLRYTRTITSGRITMQLDPEGQLKVAGKTKKGTDCPIIDISAKSLPGFEPGAAVVATFTDGAITITLEATEAEPTEAEPTEAELQRSLELAKGAGPASCWMDIAQPGWRMQVLS